MPSPTEPLLMKPTPLVPWPLPPSRRQPAGGGENLSGTPLQSNVSGGERAGETRLAGPEEQAAATRARQRTDVRRRIAQRQSAFQAGSRTLPHAVQETSPLHAGQPA